MIQYDTHAVKTGNNDQFAQIEFIKSRTRKLFLHIFVVSCDCFVMNTLYFRQP